MFNLALNPPHILQNQFKEIDTGYLCYYLLNKETSRMHYQQYLILLSRTTFTYFVHKIGKSNSVMVAARFEKLGGDQVAVHNYETHSLGQSEWQFKYLVSRKYPWLVR